MSDRSDDWFRDPAPRPSGRGGSGYPGASEPAESVFGGGNRGSVWEPGGQQAGGPGYQSPGGWPEQPPGSRRERLRPGPAVPGRPPGGTGPRLRQRGSSGRGSSGRGRRWLRPRRILAIIALVVVVVLVLSGVGYFYLNSKLTRVQRAR